MGSNRNSAAASEAKNAGGEAEIHAALTALNIPIANPEDLKKIAETNPFVVADIQALQTALHSAGPNPFVPDTIRARERATELKSKQDERAAAGLPPLPAVTLTAAQWQQLLATPFGMANAASILYIAERVKMPLTNELLAAIVTTAVTEGKTDQRPALRLADTIIGQFDSSSIDFSPAIQNQFTLADLKIFLAKTLEYEVETLQKIKKIITAGIWDRSHGATSIASLHLLMQMNKDGVNGYEALLSVGHRLPRYFDNGGTFRYEPEKDVEAEHAKEGRRITNFHMSCFLAATELWDMFKSDQQFLRETLPDQPMPRIYGAHAEYLDELTPGYPKQYNELLAMFLIRMTELLPHIPTLNTLFQKSRIDEEDEEQEESKATPLSPECLDALDLVLEKERDFLLHFYRQMGAVFQETSRTRGAAISSTLKSALLPDMIALVGEYDNPGILMTFLRNLGRARSLPTELLTLETRLTDFIKEIHIINVELKKAAKASHSPALFPPAPERPATATGSASAAAPATPAGDKVPPKPPTPQKG